MNQLINKYREASGLINYAAFCSNIDQVFDHTVDQSAVIENSKSTAKFSAEERECLSNLLASIRAQIKDRRILIKPQFRDYDKACSCHITAEQFRRVLKTCGLLPPSEELY